MLQLVLDLIYETISIGYGNLLIVIIFGYLVNHLNSLEPNNKYQISCQLSPIEKKYWFLYFYVDMICQRIQILHFNLRRIIYHSLRLKSHFNVMGIETSCDDTGCGIVNSEHMILGESLYSQNVTHVRYGGVNPIIAYELHRQNIEFAINDALCRSSLKMNDIDAIAVTIKPGMLINLKVGTQYAMYLSKRYSKPIIPIHHMEAHALAVRLFIDVPFPFLVLLISGGHCLLALVEDVDKFLLLGECLDNPPGEVLDKVARRMKLKNIPECSYLSGGRAIELLAKKANDMTQFIFPTPLLRYRDCNFSFSGLKDSLNKKLIKKEAEHHIIGDEIIPEVHELCASFQLAIAEHIAHRTERAILYCEKNGLFLDSKKYIVVSGGVACNDFIFNCIKIIGNRAGCNVFRPPPKLCTDNGVMIAWNGVEKMNKKNSFNIQVNIRDVTPKAPLGKSLLTDVLHSDIPVRVPRLIKYLKRNK